MDLISGVSLTKLNTIYKNAWESIPGIAARWPGIRPANLITNASAKWVSCLQLTQSLFSGELPLRPEISSRYSSLIQALKTAMATNNEDFIESAILRTLTRDVQKPCNIRTLPLFLYSENYQTSEFLKTYLVHEEIVQSDDALRLILSGRQRWVDKVKPFLTSERGRASVIEAARWWQSREKHLEAANYGPWGASKVRTVLGFLMELSQYCEAYESRVGDDLVLRTTGPVWWGFLDHILDRYQVRLEPSGKRVDTPPLPARQISPVRRPGMYAAWSVTQQRLWDLEHLEVSKFPLTPEASSRMEERRAKGFLEEEDISYILGIDML